MPRASSCQILANSTHRTYASAPFSGRIPEIGFLPCMTDMTDPVSQPRDLKLAPLGGLMLLSCLFGPMFAYGLAVLAVWGDGTSSTLLLPAILGGGVWAFAAALGLGLIALTSRGKVSNLGFPVLAASIIRMFVAFSLGLVLYFSLKCEGKTFWASFLVTGLVCLTVETAWAFRTLTASPAASSTGVR
jgi:hypothetical protein